MRKHKIRDFFKKILIIITCMITIGFSMPQKSSAGPFEELINIVLKLPDGVMALLNIFGDGDLSAWKWQGVEVNLKGWGVGTSGRLMDFSVTPYDIFTSGFKYNKPYDSNGSLSKAETIKLPILDINFFRKDDGSAINYQDSIVYTLRPVVSNVYKNLRNLTLIAMLVVLIYIGIRIVTATAVTDQVKYKQWIIDWVVGICLVLGMHYIMSFLISLNQMAVDMLSNTNENTYYISFSNQSSDSQETTVEKMAKFSSGIVGIVARAKEIFSWVEDSVDPTNKWDATAEKYKQFTIDHLAIGTFNYDEDTGTVNVGGVRDDFGDNGKVFLNARVFKEGAVGSKTDIAVYKCNIVEYCRTLTSFGSKYEYIYLQKEKDGKNVVEGIAFSDSDEVDETNPTYIGYVILYFLLVCESVIFFYIYLKRVIKLAFYTMIAPLIALMYPLDKLGDGKAQAFNFWFKDYLFNVLIQPLHLLLYTIFIYATGDLLHQNQLYAIVCYAYMISAEKFFKKIFGFDKAPGGTPSLMGPATADIARSGLRRLFPPPGGGPGGNGGNGQSNPANDRKIHFAKGGRPTPSNSGGNIGNNPATPFSSGSESGLVSSLSGRKLRNANSRNSLTPNSDGDSKLKKFFDVSRSPLANAAKNNFTSWASQGQRDASGKSIAKGLAIKGAKGLGKGLWKGAKVGLAAGAAIGAGALGSALTGKDQFGKGLAGAAGIIGAGAYSSIRSGVAGLKNMGSNFHESVKQYKQEEDKDYAQKQKEINLRAKDPIHYDKQLADLKKLDDEAVANGEQAHYMDDFHKIMYATNKVDENNFDDVISDIKSGNDINDIYDGLEDPTSYDLGTEKGQQKFMQSHPITDELTDKEKEQIKNNVQVSDSEISNEIARRRKDYRKKYEDLRAQKQEMITNNVSASSPERKKLESEMSRIQTNMKNLGNQNSRKHIEAKIKYQKATTEINKAQKAKNDQATYDYMLTRKNMKTGHK